MIDKIAHVVTVYRRQRAGQRLVNSILDRWPDEYLDYRGRGRFQAIQNSKMGTGNGSMPDCDGYQYGEPDWPERDWDSVLSFPK